MTARLLVLAIWSVGIPISFLVVEWYLRATDGLGNALMYETDRMPVLWPLLVFFGANLVVLLAVLWRRPFRASPWWRSRTALVAVAAASAFVVSLVLFFVARVAVFGPGDVTVAEDARQGIVFALLLEIVVLPITLRFLGTRAGLPAARPPRTPRAPGTPRAATGSRWDVFLCHASEDKEAIVEPIVEALEAAGISCWYDRERIPWGDSIPDGVNEGLLQSRYVLVVVSRTFVDKPWARAELQSVLASQNATGHVRLLPLVVPDADGESPLARLPLLAGAHHLAWDGSPATVVAALRARLAEPPPADIGVV